MGRRIVGVVVGGLVILMLASLAVFNTATKVDVHCGPYVTTPKITRYLDFSAKLGRVFYNLEHDLYTPRMIADKLGETFSLMGLFKKVFQANANGTTEPDAATGWRNAGKEAQDAALASCCPVMDQNQVDPNSPPPPNTEPFDPKTLSVSTSGSSSGGEKAVWDALRGLGWSEVHTAGAMGNMKDESGFSATIVQGGGHSNRPSAAGGGGYGLVQWTPGRKLSDYLGGAQPTVENEVAVLNAQLKGQGPHPEKAAGSAFFKAQTVEQAAKAFHLRYERSLSKNSTQRVANARAILSRHSSGGSQSQQAQGGTTVEQLPNAMQDQVTPQDCATGGGGSMGGDPGNNTTGYLGGTVSMVANLNPAGAGNFQAAVKDGQYWYVAKATTGNNAAVVHRLRPDGTQVSEMRITGKAHPTGFGVRNGQVYMDVNDKVMTFPYQGGTTISGASTTFTGWRGEIGIDPNGGNAVIRQGNKYRLFNLGTRKQIGVQVRTAPGMRQGFGVSGRVLYILSGRTNSKATVESWSFVSGRKIADRDVSKVGFMKGEDTGANREPEGVFGNMIGVKVFTGDKRRLRVYSLNAAPSVSSPGVRGVRVVKSYGKTYQVQVPNGAAGRAISFALDQVGDPYDFGAHGPDAWDCSGLVAGAWAKGGVRIPAQTYGMLGHVPEVPKSQMQPGDLAWWYGDRSRKIGHVGVYLGDGLMVEAPRSGIDVRVRKMTSRPDKVLRPLNQGTAA